MKTIPLIKANLKGFIRNWKSVLLLIILPLFLISVIFLSFNPSGLRKIDIGYSFAEEQTLDEGEFTKAVDTFARLHKYDSLESCTAQLELYKEYVCIHISGTGPYVLDVYYDNTREPVIWEVIERIKQSIQFVQREHSRNLADDFLTRFKAAMARLDEYDSSLQNIDADLDGYVDDAGDSITDLQNARSELIATIAQMDNDIRDAKTASRDARMHKNNEVSMARQSLNTAEYYIDAIEPAEGYAPYAGYASDAMQDARDRIDELDSQVTNGLDDIDTRLANYEAASARGKTYSGNIQRGLADLQSTRNQLISYRSRVASTRDDLRRIKQEFSSLESLDAETLVNPVVIRNIPAYVPYVDLPPEEEVTAEDQAKGFSFIALQTIFPTVLVLITMFLALLIGAFVTLNEVNEKSHERIRLIAGSFMSEFMATLVSSFAIVAIPIIIVVLIGDSLFRLGMWSSAFHVLILLGLLTVNCVLLGLLLAYTIRKESMTLMTSTFVLILMIFLSGFLLPLERMSALVATFAALSPATLTLEAFKKAVFYSAGFAGISGAVAIMAMSAVALGVFALVMKHMRE